MSRAKINRQAGSAGDIQYVVTAASLGLWNLLISMPFLALGVLILSVIFGFIGGAITALVAGNSDSPNIKMVGLGVFAGTLLLAFIFIKKGLGRRGTFRFSIDRDGVAISTGGSRGLLDRIGSASIRRIRIANTYVGTAFENGPSTAIGFGASAAAAASIHNAAQTAGSGVVGAIKSVCFSVVLDHENTSRLLADGLDAMTAENLLDDVSRDLNEVHK